MQTCPVPDCGKEYKNNAGLASHMFMAHQMTRTGELLSAEAIEERKKHLSDALTKRMNDENTPKPTFTKRTMTAAHSPAARAKAGKAIRERHFEKLKEKGIYRCAECWDKLHRPIDFKTPTELGKHRRFKHGVLGRSHTAVVMRKLATANQAKLELAETPTPAKTPSATPFACTEPDCERSFRSQHGLSIHISQAHKPSTALTPTTSQELLNGHTSTHETNGRNGHRNDAALAQALAIAHVTGVIENILLATASKYDLPPRQFAKRSLIALSERYQEER